MLGSPEMTNQTNPELSKVPIQLASYVSMKWSRVKSYPAVMYSTFSALEAGSSSTSNVPLAAMRLYLTMFRGHKPSDSKNKIIKIKDRPIVVICSFYKDSSSAVKLSLNAVITNNLVNLI